MSERYSRQELFTPIGSSGQALLAEKHVFIVGAGALGSSNAEMLTRAGVGKITIIDRDYIDWSNLTRQQLYTEEDARQYIPKAKAAENRLRTINSEIEVNGIADEFSAETAGELLQNVDIVIDGTDNFETRFIMNDITAKHNVPWIYGGCVKSHGISLPILPGETPCLQCLIDQIPQEGMTCDTVGIISPVVQMTAAYQTTECLKFLTDHPMSTEMVYFDIWERQHSSINVKKLLNPTCSSCSSHATYPYLTKEKGIRTAVLCGRDTVQVRPSATIKLTLEDLSIRLKPISQKLHQNRELLVFTVEEFRLVVFKDGRTLVHGTSDVSEAKKLYQQYIGA
ncbi:ThiF family adenylyltransferase [Halobacillus seohaensis]|uniref:ThiF family adenylyltransferase n=1 Tax=Halobacillus seohaensis TaxID=447421 RepID=A0ABW2EME0_9BACI